MDRQWGFTPAESPYPPYLNVTEKPGGDFVITVRSPAKADGSCGDSSAITMTGDDFRLFLKELAGALDR